MSPYDREVTSYGSPSSIVRMNGVDGSHKERIPPATTLRASLRVTF